MEKNIESIIQNPEKIYNIIQELLEAFPAIFSKYNSYERDALEFYMLGHCASFADILSEIFKGHAVQFANNAHFITKIGEDFFDAAGIANGEYEYPHNGEEYRALADGPLIYEFCSLTTPDDHDEEIRYDLIKIGKQKVEEMLKEINQEETHHKTMW